MKIIKKIFLLEFGESNENIGSSGIRLVKEKSTSATPFNGPYGIKRS